MLDRILVPLDGSAVAEQVLPYVQAFGRERNGLVTLLHVVDPETLERKDPEHARYIDQMVGRAEIRARDYLRQLERRVRPMVSCLDSKLLTGPAPDMIVDYAETQGYSLIAMSTHGRSGVGRWVFGSVADRVLHATRLPLLLVRPPSGGEDVPALSPLRRALVPLDGSDLAAEALPYAVELAKRLGLEVHLIRVIQYQMGAGFGLYVEDPTGELERFAEEYLTGVQRRVEEQGVSAKGVLLWGYAGSRIVEAAQAEPGTLVVISSHGRSGVGRWVLGSVADKVVRAAGVPVLVIRPEAAQETTKEE